MPRTVTPTIATRSVSHDETNKRGRTKKEITDEDGQIQQTKKNTGSKSLTVSIYRKINAIKLLLIHIYFLYYLI